jgi:LPXTG-motif cell wall-anchored protein
MWLRVAIGWVLMLLSLGGVIGMFWAESQNVPEQRFGTQNLFFGLLGGALIGLGLIVTLFRRTKE